MKQDEAKRKIRLLWAERPANKRTNLSVIEFYNHLEKEHKELLNFRYRKGADKYQIIKIWLTGYTSD